MMKLVRGSFLLTIILFLLLASICYAGFEYKAYREHKGGDITPVEAYRMVRKNSKNTFLVDVRTRAEYQFVGHAEGAYNIPFMFLSNDVDERGYKFIPNPDFCKELLDLFNPETDTLLIYCKVGGRSLMATEAAFKAGFPESRIFNVMGGFEGDINSNRESIYNGKPYYGGWVSEGLPWTYNMYKSLMYQPDLRPWFKDSRVQGVE